MTVIRAVRGSPRVLASEYQWYILRIAGKAKVKIMRATALFRVKIG